MASQDPNQPYSPNKGPSGGATAIDRRLILAAVMIGMGLIVLLGVALLVGCTAQPGRSQEHTASSSSSETSIELDAARPRPQAMPAAQSGLTKTDSDPLALRWTSQESEKTNSVAWGDYDGDGDLDLAVGNQPGWEEDSGKNQVYENDMGTLKLVWTSPQTDTTRSVAWGDCDGDGDLDLAVGNYLQPNRIYLNDGVTSEDRLTFTPLEWSPAAEGATMSVAWGDYDGDRDLDLAVGNDEQQVNWVYRNEGMIDGLLTFTGVWSSTENNTYSLAWGDYNGDGRLDLAVGNEGSLRLYQNDGHGGFISDQSWPGPGYIASVAWGDCDGDGDLDLAFGQTYSGSPAQVYRNDNGVLTPDWSPSEEIRNYAGESVAWGDYDGDRDLDLAVGNQLGPNRVYRNNGLPTEDTFTFELAWLSNEEDFTKSVAWGDYNGDGKLDLAVGNGFLSEQSNRIYQNSSGGLTTRAVWKSENSQATSLAWGDFDNDGDLDLAIGNDFHNQLYRNDGLMNQSTPVLNLVWNEDEDENASTQSVAWGDYDNDRDLDLIVGNRSSVMGKGEFNWLYRNDGTPNDGTPIFNFAWPLPEAEDTHSVAWGDYDGDGDLDLAVGNYFDPEQPQFNRIYRNDGLADDGTPLFNPVWSSEEKADRTMSVAWGDYDGDGDLDLAVGNRGQPNRLYGNDGVADDGTPIFNLVWSSDEADDTRDVAWGDYDGDGYLDLAVGNRGQPARLYRNDNRALTRSSVWSSNEADLTTSVAWGDYDADGDLDLAAGNENQPNRVYGNDGGTLTVNAIWSSDERDPTRGVAWGDVDGDGDLDLAAGNGAASIPHRLYGNTRVHPGSVSVPTIYLVRPMPPANAGHYSSSHIWSGPTISLPYTLYFTGLPVKYVVGLYSLDGGDNWWPAAPTEDTQTTNLTTSADGITHTYTWDVFKSGVFGQSDNVVFRLIVVPEIQPAGPYLYSSYSASTFPFRVRGNQVLVLDKDSQPVPNALVYRNGVREPFRTNSQGFLQGRGQIETGDKLVAMQPITATDGYTLYHTSARPIETGLEAYGVNLEENPGIQTLTVSADYPLILLNLDVSLEWDASNDEIYQKELERNLRRASEVLYDLSNGGMALGDVRVYQAKERWQDANLVVYARDGVRPNADLGGYIEPGEVVPETIYINGQAKEITDAYVAGQIRMGAAWSRFGSTEGNLDEDWARALAHELAHYFLFLLDNYLGVDGDLVVPVDCEGSAMSDPYRDDYSEFLPQGDWKNDCLQTLAQDITGRPDWETIVKFHPALEPLKPDTANKKNPGPRALPLQVTQIEFIKPSTPADLLPVPFFNLEDAKSGDAVFPAGQAQGYLIKTQNNSDQTDDYIIALGSPNQDLLHARGAAEGDKVCLFDYSHHPTRVGCEIVKIQSGSTVTLHEIEYWPPQVTITPVTSQTFAITVTAHSHYSDHTFYAQIIPEAGRAPTTTLNLIQGNNDRLVAYNTTIQLDKPTLGGFTRVWVDSRDSITQTITEFSLHGEWPACWGRWCGKPWWAWWAPVYSEDGGLAVFDRAQLLGSETSYVQTLTAPPELDPWLTPVGQAYRVSTISPLQQGSVLFSYLERNVPLDQEDWLDIYYYAPNEKQSWQPLATRRDSERNIAAAKMPPGAEVYALMSTMPIPSFTPGWNNFGYATPITQSVTMALASISDAYTSIYHYDIDNDQWTLYDQTVPTEFDSLNINDLKQLEFGHGYWIYANKSATLYLPVANADQPGEELLLRALLAQSQAGNLPTPPATFYGEVVATDAFAPAEGMPVTAKIGGKECSEPGQQVTGMSGKLAYKLQVEPPDRCDAQGQTITFYVDGRKMDQEPEWNNNKAHYLPLSTGEGPGPGPTCEHDLIINGTMESDEGWILNLAEPAQYVADPRGGGRSLRVGLPSGTQLGYWRWSSARQTVTLPVGQNAMLSLNYLLQADPWPGTDKQLVAILDIYGCRSGCLLEKWYLPLSHNGQWQAFSKDISRYAGRTIQVYVGTKNDGFGGATQLLVDDVTLCIR